MHHATLKYRTRYIEELVAKRHEELTSNRRFLHECNKHNQTIRTLAQDPMASASASPASPAAEDTPGFGFSTGRFGVSTEIGGSVDHLRANSTPSLSNPSRRTAVRAGPSALAPVGGAAESMAPAKSMRERMQALKSAADDNASELSRQKDFLNGYNALRAQAQTEPAPAENPVAEQTLAPPDALAKLLKTAPPNRDGSLHDRFGRVLDDSYKVSRDIHELRQRSHHHVPSSKGMDDTNFKGDGEAPLPHFPLSQNHDLISRLGAFEERLKWNKVKMTGHRQFLEEMKASKKNGPA